MKLSKNYVWATFKRLFLITVTGFAGYTLLTETNNITVIHFYFLYGFIAGGTLFALRGGKTYADDLLYMIFTASTAFLPTSFWAYNADQNIVQADILVIITIITTTIVFHFLISTITQKERDAKIPPKRHVTL